MTLISILRQRRKRITRPRRIRLVNPSKRAEVWYRGQLELLVKELKKIALYEVSRKTLNDAAPTNQKLKLSKKLSALTVALEGFDVAKWANQVVNGMVTRVSRQNNEQTVNAFKSAFGIDINQVNNSQAVTDEINLAIENNVNLISSIKSDFVTGVSDIIRGNLFDDGTGVGLTQLIHNLGGVTLSRAAGIARDQTSKLNGSITRIRNEELGLDLYIWAGANDERERPSHRLMNGKLCKYSDSTVYSDDNGKTWRKRSELKIVIKGKTIRATESHPTEDPFCRCGAITYIEQD